MHVLQFLFFFFNDTATTEIYTLSLHDALPISELPLTPADLADFGGPVAEARIEDLVADGVLRRRPTGWYWAGRGRPDRKSTRLNSSHANISYAVFCLKKKQHDNSYLSPVLDSA